MTPVHALRRSWKLGRSLSGPGSVSKQGWVGEWLAAQSAALPDVTGLDRAPMKLLVSRQRTRGATVIFDLQSGSLIAWRRPCICRAHAGRGELIASSFSRHCRSSTWGVRVLLATTHRRCVGTHQARVRASRSVVVLCGKLAQDKPRVMLAPHSRFQIAQLTLRSGGGDEALSPLTEAQREAASASENRPTVLGPVRGAGKHARSQAPALLRWALSDSGNKSMDSAGCVSAGALQLADRGQRRLQCDCGEDASATGLGDADLLVIRQSSCPERAHLLVCLLVSACTQPLLLAVGRRRLRRLLLVCSLCIKRERRRWAIPRPGPECSAARSTLLLLAWLLTSDARERGRRRLPRPARKLVSSALRLAASSKCAGVVAKRQRHLWMQRLSTRPREPATLAAPLRHPSLTSRPPSSSAGQWQPLCGSVSDAH
jgi:hypothetical protein